MTVGEKIKLIRTFRGMTQKELGLAIGLEEKGADNRIAQYETNYRVPKKDMLDKFAEVLHVNRQNFYTDVDGTAEAIMRNFFWLDEDIKGVIHLFELCRNPGSESKSQELKASYTDNLEWPASAPVGLYFDYPLLNEFMVEWRLRQQELFKEEITRDEYFEWKINWPYTCDDAAGREEYIPWRKIK